MRLTEALLFLPLATGLHLGVWSVAPASIGASATGGPGQAQVTLAAATAQHADLVKTWQSPPRTAPTPTLQQAYPVTAPSELPKFSPDQMVPTLPPAPSLPPVLPAALPAALPQTDPQPPQVTPPSTVARAPAQPQNPAPQPMNAPRTNPAPTVQTPPPARPASPRPDALASADTALPAPPPPPPKPKAKRKTSTSAPAAAPRVSGGGKSKKPQSGRSGKDATQSANTATRNALRAKWGAKIQGKVLRRLIYPRGANGSGVARVALTIDRGGRLTGLRLAKSSGVAVFDQAALNAVRRAGRFPKAPKALTDPNYTFSMSLTFKP